MSTLRVAFLSGAVFEFPATLSVALVVAEVRMRLVIGGIDLTSDPAVVVPAPKVLESLRQVGAQFHTSANGVATAQAASDIIEVPRPNQAKDMLPAPNLRHTMIELKGVSVAARGTWAPYHPNTRTEPASFTVLAGCSGSGKTASVLTIPGLLKVTRGSIALVPGNGPTLDLHDVDLASWWESITWVPQASTLVPGIILDNFPRLDVDDSLIDAARATGFPTVVEPQTTGWDTMIGVGGVGLSFGQRQRLALARALPGNAPLVVPGEPTTCLDTVNENEAIRVIQALHAQGKTLFVIAYHRLLVSITNHVINIETETASAGELKKYPELLGDTLPKEIIDIETSGVFAGLATHISSTDARRERAQWGLSLRRDAHS